MYIIDTEDLQYVDVLLSHRKLTGINRESIMNQINKQND